MTTASHHCVWPHGETSIVSESLFKPMMISTITWVKKYMSQRVLSHVGKSIVDHFTEFPDHGPTSLDIWRESSFYLGLPARIARWRHVKWYYSQEPISIDGIREWWCTEMTLSSNHRQANRDHGIPVLHRPHGKNAIFPQIYPNEWWSSQ
jgi:hypothetical protein